MTKSLTKAQLVDQLASLREHCDYVETQLASLRAQRSAPARPAYVRPAPVVTPEQLAFRARCAAAKAAAIAGGRAVAV